jgi:hypothetical protein
VVVLLVVVIVVVVVPAPPLSCCVRHDYVILVALLLRSAGLGRGVRCLPVQDAQHEAEANAAAALRAHDAAVDAFQSKVVRLIDGLMLHVACGGAPTNFYTIPACVPAAERTLKMDLSSWARLESYVRARFAAARDAPIQLALYLGDAPCGVVCDESTREGAVQQLLLMGASRLRAAPRIDALVQRVHAVTRVLPPLAARAPPLSNGERAELVRALKAAVYSPTGAVWTSAADALMASAPGHVYLFLRVREQVAAASGDGRLVLNPVAAFCPFRSRTCTDDTCVHQLGGLNDVGILQRHLRVSHAHNPMACTLVRRLEHVLHVDQTTAPEVLDALLPWPDGMGGDQLRMDLLGDRADVWLPVAPARIHPTAMLLNELLLPRVGRPYLTPQHLLVQSVDALCHVAYGVHTADWNVQLPTLASFAMQLYHVGHERAYRLVAGSTGYGLGRGHEVLYPVASAYMPNADSPYICVNIHPWKPWMLRTPVGATFGARRLDTLRLRLVLRPEAPSTTSAPLLLVLEALDGADVVSLLEAADGLVLRRERIIEARSVNLPLPPVRCIIGWELPPERGSATHFHSNAAFIELALTTPNVPLILLPLCRIVPVASATDARPLNQGVFGMETVVDGQLTVQLGGAYRKLPDGSLAPFDAATIQQLIAKGNNACRKAMKGAVFVKDTLETVSTTLDSKVVLNTSTWFQTGNPKSTQVALDVKERKAALECCLGCIAAGLSSCAKGIDGRCNRCRLLGISCDYIKEVALVTDKESEQRKGLDILNEERRVAKPPLLAPSFLYTAFAIRHFIKGPIGGLRGHRLASVADGELAISLLRALVVSGSPLALELARITRTDVFLCKDKHSDVINWLTCQPAVQDVLRRTDHCAYQLVPEPHIGWHPRCKQHDLVRRVGCVALNCRGEAIISELEGNVLLMVSRHVPAQVKIVAGKWGGPGRTAAVEAHGKLIKLSFPWGLAHHVISPGKREVCFFADAGLYHRSLAR